ncbi:hypothetical protein AK812_SmicGene41243 [Symbiodinium microadriaticum]|uniref:Uncharacterized protein n=1 Tax=Symbiodinium microadriaticum TaxID=2951 RepID=A0A1Q9C6M7_SYMMI|nr:hypothetical protein AK812_SmicGene41243 [Symbiodinium microadriaticum]
MSSFTVGCRVRVLRGRHFADFEEGDEGTVLDINAECRNCTVVFDRSQARIKVALKHLRLISQRAEGRSGAPYADGVDTSSPTALATKMAQEMRLADAASVKALEAQAEDLRSRLAAALHRADASEAVFPAFVSCTLTYRHYESVGYSTFDTATVASSLMPRITICDKHRLGLIRAGTKRFFEHVGRRRLPRPC